MILLAGFICFCLTVLVGYLNVRQDIERKHWAKERQLLITRIQHPEIVPVGADAPMVEDDELMTAPEPDDIDLVGTVASGDQD